MNDEINEFLSEFENEKNLKYFLSFENLNIEYTEKEFKIIKPKPKKKLNVEKWVKPKNNNSLF